MELPLNDTPAAVPVPGFMVFDTETTGLFRYDRRADADGQPRMAEIKIAETTPTFAVIAEHHFLIKPDGWLMPPEAGRINGLTTDRLIREGVPVVAALSIVNEMLDRGLIPFAFNVDYDLKVLRAELRRAGMPDRYETTHSVCAMKRLIGVCKIPKARGGGYKQPKLAEALAHFKIVQQGAHTAGGDVHGLLELGKMMHKIGIDLTPSPPVMKSLDRLSETGGEDEVQTFTPPARRAAKPAAVSPDDEIPA